LVLITCMIVLYVWRKGQSQRLHTK
jgi:hypothetical protein